MSAHARFLRCQCGHDSFTFEGCEYCAAADELEFLATRTERLISAAGLALFALNEEAAAYPDPIDHVIKGRDALLPFFPRGVDCFGEHKQSAAKKAGQS